MRCEFRSLCCPSSTQRHVVSSEQSSICQHPVAINTVTGVGMFILYENISGFLALFCFVIVVILAPEITSPEYPMDKQWNIFTEEDIPDMQCEQICTVYCLGCSFIC